MLSSPDEEQRLFGLRLERYRAAVQHGFFNESPDTIPYRGFHILSMDEKWHVMQNGTSLISVLTPHIAKVWVTCRLDNMAMADANRKVRAETA